MAWSEAARKSALEKRRQRQREKYKAHDLGDEALATEHRKRVGEKVTSKRYGGSTRKRFGSMTDDQLLAEVFDGGQTYQHRAMQEVRRRDPSALRTNAWSDAAREAARQKRRQRQKTSGVFLSRKKHDQLIDTHPKVMASVFPKLKRKWNLAGVALTRKR